MSSGPQCSGYGSMLRGMRGYVVVPGGRSERDSDSVEVEHEIPGGPMDPDIRRFPGSGGADDVGDPSAHSARIRPKRSGGVLLEAI